MKKEKELCKYCAEYGSAFCPECLDELGHSNRHTLAITASASNTVNLTPNCYCVATMIDTNSFTTQIVFATHGVNIWSTTVSNTFTRNVLTRNTTVEQVTLETGLEVMLSWTGASMPVILVTGQILDSSTMYTFVARQVF